MQCNEKWQFILSFVVFEEEIFNLNREIFLEKNKTMNILQNNNT